MTAQKSLIGYPWILDAIAKYNGGVLTPKAAPAQVVEFLKMPARSKECQYPGGIVYISDRRYYIRAIITKEAQETLEREDEHFTVADIKNKIIILKKFTLSFAAEEDLRCCEFFLTIQHFSVLPMETDRVDLLNCNVEPDVRKKIKELWQNYKAELEMKEAFADLNSSDVSLTQLLIIASEEKLSSLKSVAEQCLDLELYATQEIAAEAKTTWSLQRRNNKNQSGSFTFPMNLLIIPPEEEAALEQMAELSTNNSACDADDSSVDENASTQYSTAASTLSQESMEDACNSLLGNPWNNVPSICLTGSTGSAALESNSSVTPQKCGREIGVDSDSTPDIYKEYPDNCMSYSYESQEQSPSLLPPKLPSDVTVHEAEMSTSKNLAGASSGSPVIPFSQMKAVAFSPSLASSIPDAQDCLKGSQVRVVYSSPPKTQAVHTNPLLSCSSETDTDFRFHGKILSSNSPVSKISTSREKKAMKRKQTPEDQDATLSDREESSPVCIKKRNCPANVSISERITSVANKSNGAQHDITGQTDKGGRAAGLSERRKVVQATDKGTGMSPARKKAPPYKQSLEFVAQPKLNVTKYSENVLPATSMHTSSTPCKDTSSTSWCKRTSASTTPALHMRKARMTHVDGTPFKYKYKPPSADLRACVKALQMPTELRKWAKK